MWRRGASILATALASVACSDDAPSARTAVPEDGSVESGGASGGSAGGSANGGTSAGGAGASANGGRSGGVGGVDPAAGGVVGVGGTYIFPVETPTELIAPKLDLLVVVDNSYGMTDHQQVLESTIGDMLRAITNAASKVTDLHVGVITSSIGGHGAEICNGSPEGLDDKGHLLGTRPRAASLGISTGFVSWTGGNTDSLITNVTGLIRVAGEDGCGFEAPFESLYRFLADPNPPVSVTVGPCPSASNTCALRNGTDSETLAQRAAFLRPDSAVAIVLLSNEDDCSVRESGQFYLAAEPRFIMPKASAACDANPNDPCCYSCALTAPSGCTPEPTCQPSSSLPLAEDLINLRCFDQKRRFGLDFLYPVKRYVNALSQPTLCPANADLDVASCAAGAVPNPLFAGTRAPTSVQLVGIVGVPWQTISKQSGAGTLEYKQGSEYTASDWAKIHGAPSASPPVPPTDPLMVASITPRTGTTPGTGEPLAPPSAGYMANSVNGHERSNSRPDDLQYTCVFPLVTPKDCSVPNSTVACECSAGDNDQNPICQTSDGTYGAVQRFAKAYPGLRHVALARELGATATLTSICPKNMRDPTQTDYAYRPVLNVLLRELAREPITP